MKIRYMVVSCLCVLLFTSSVFAERPSQNGKVVLLFGNLHAHTALSDNVPAKIVDELLPKQAIEYAHQYSLDFLATTDPNKRKGPFRPSFLKVTPDEYRNQLYYLAMEYNASHSGQFIPSIDKIKGFIHYTHDSGELFEQYNNWASVA